jgi:hypothetical protein
MAKKHLFQKQITISWFCCVLAVLQSLPFCYCAFTCAAIARMSSEACVQSEACCQSGTCQRLSDPADSCSSNSHQSSTELVEACSCLTANGFTSDSSSPCPVSCCFLKRAPATVLTSGSPLRFLEQHASLLDLPHVCPPSTGTGAKAPLSASLFSTAMSAPMRLAWICVWLK